jgi:deoxyribodipyrimidine photo-lyase
MRAMPQFTPTRDAGLAQLRAVAAMLGRDYAAGRNTDRGPDAPHPSTSALSPWLRHGLLLEEEAIRAALAAHGSQAAAKFVEEVAWRAYFKGWLEGRPAVWEDYRRQVRHDRDRLAVESGLRRVHDDACAGRTGIACFDDWARELVEQGWLHNHARMWFASIWIFTLRLPWALGADFFLRHLLDGDPASNTLSWRWVGGLHTRGKHYVARAENIARYTDGRYDPSGQLNENPAPLPADDVLPPHRVPPPERKPEGRVALLLHEDDLALDGLDLDGLEVAAVAGFSARAGTAVCGCAGPVVEFAQAGLEDALRRAEERFGVTALRLGAGALFGWTTLPVVTPHAPVGPAAAALAEAQVSGLPLFRLRRPWHAASWPHAGRGFFQVRARLPDLLAASGIAA